MTVFRIALRFSISACLTRIRTKSLHINNTFINLLEVFSVTKFLSTIVQVCVHWMMSILSVMIALATMHNIILFSVLPVIISTRKYYTMLVYQCDYLKRIWKKNWKGDSLALNRAFSFIKLTTLPHHLRMWFHCACTIELWNTAIYSILHIILTVLFSYTGACDICPCFTVVISCYTVPVVDYIVQLEQ